jgi:transcriptional regulator with XRE-family HTH domain
MKTPDERGRYGRWLVASREARGWGTAQKALDAMAAAGIRIGKSTYAEYESGSKTPSRNHLPLLERFWGPVPALGSTETPDGVLAAVKVLVDEIRAERAARVEWERGFLEAMRELARAAAPRAGRGRVTPADARR